MLLADSEPTFDPDAYTEFGKLMDGWETRRKRIAGHDWCIIRLGAACKIKGILADTAFFTGNYVPKVSIQAAYLKPEGNLYELLLKLYYCMLFYDLMHCIDEKLFPTRCGQMGSACTVAELEQINKLRSELWDKIVDVTPMKPGYEETRRTYIDVASEKVFTHLRLNYFPDGGLARLRVYGNVEINFTGREKELIDLMSLHNGSVCLTYSNAHYGHPNNLIKPSKSTSMADGWETARRLDRPTILETDENGNLRVTGSEFAVFRLGAKGRISQILIDTNHFKGNFPDRIQIEGALAKEDEDIDKVSWKSIVIDYKVWHLKRFLIFLTNY